MFVANVVSEPFKVVSQKEFRGLSESTHLSRTFSDQGVRLRLRKEPRSITGCVEAKMSRATLADIDQVEAVMG